MGPLGRFWASLVVLGFVLAALGGARAAQAQSQGIPSKDVPPGTTLHVSVNELPAPYASPSVANSPLRLERLPAMLPQVAEGWQASLFSDGFEHARWLAVAPDGAVFLSQSSSGEVTILRDLDGDGRADTRDVFANRLYRPHGIVFGHGGVYIADTQGVWYAPYPAKTLPVSLQPITPPDAFGSKDGHWTRTLALSADERTLFVAIGSRGNIGVEPLPRASVQAFTLSDDGRLASAQRTFAAGLRNPVGLAWQPGQDRLWTVVNERDGLGDGLVPDYLAPLEAGDFYGWPYSYLGQHPQPDLDLGSAQATDAAALVARAKVPPVLFASHSAPLGLVFDRQGNAIVALHGSWNAQAPRGYMVVEVPFHDGQPEGSYRVLASGFRVADQDGEPVVWGRPVGLAWAQDGALLVADDVSQSIWRLRPPVDSGR